MKRLGIVSVGLALLVTLLALGGSPVRAQPVASIALPPPRGTVQLYSGCNNIALTFPDGTASQAVVQAVTPAGMVDAMWRHNAALNMFEGFSPTAPQASDLLSVNLWDAVWLCVTGATPAATATPAPAPPTATPVPPTATRVPPTATPIPQTKPLGPPQDLGPVQAGGKAQVTISNDTPYTLTVEFQGPESRTLSIPPCPTCVKYTVPPAFCPEGRPQSVITLMPGTYRVSVNSDDLVPMVGQWDLHADTGYFICDEIITVDTSG